jgi:voltage-gated potassium channel
MVDARPQLREHGNAYNIFVLILTLFSLAVMVLQLLPLNAPTLELLRWYDNAICVIFLGDFAYNLSGSRPRRGYFIYQRGWLDLLGSIPTLGFFNLTALFRLARLSRLARIARLMGGQNRKQLIEDVVQNRGQYATFITLLLAGMVISTASLVVLNSESRSPEANIKTGGDAIWWAFVTITTVGYGDTFPVTSIGRATAVFVMFAGVGIIGALASILASLLVPDAPAAAATKVPEGADPEPAAGDVAKELALLRAELAALREVVTARPSSGG